MVWLTGAYVNLENGSFPTKLMFLGFEDQRYIFDKLPSILQNMSLANTGLFKENEMNTCHRASQKSCDLLNYFDLLLEY